MVYTYSIRFLLSHFTFFTNPLPLLPNVELFLSFIIVCLSFDGGLQDVTINLVMHQFWLLLFCKDDKDDKILSCTMKSLKEGHVVAVPTDTIYGLACLAQNSEAIRKIYDIKGRHQQKPLAICVGQILDIYKWVFAHLYAGFYSVFILFYYDQWKE